MSACSGDDGRSTGQETPPSPSPPPAAAIANPDTLSPPVPNGEPMPAADTAGGIPPYPGAIVWMANRAPSSTYRAYAFTPDPWERVSAFYQESLPGWRLVRTRDAIVFQKEPDQAAVTISPWDHGALPADAPEVLRGAQTAIGIAWRPTP